MLALKKAKGAVYVDRKVQFGTTKYKDLWQLLMSILLFI